MKVPKCLHCLNCPKFGQLILTKIIRIVATRYQLLVQMHEIRSGWGFFPYPTGVALEPHLTGRTAHIPGTVNETQIFWFGTHIPKRNVTYHNVTKSLTVSD